MTSWSPPNRCGKAIASPRVSSSIGPAASTHSTYWRADAVFTELAQWLGSETTARGGQLVDGRRRRHETRPPSRPAAWRRRDAEARQSAVSADSQRQPRTQPLPGGGRPLRRAPARRRRVVPRRQAGRELPADGCGSASIRRTKARPIACGHLEALAALVQSCSGSATSARRAVGSSSASMGKGVLAGSRLTSSNRASTTPRTRSGSPAVVVGAPGRFGPSLEGAVTARHPGRRSAPS